MAFRVPEQYRNLTHPILGTTHLAGNNGLFRLPAIRKSDLSCIASDGDGWEHVSVSLVDHPTAVPNWEEMCHVKSLFWEPEDVVIQYHPSEANKVNYHLGCLHLWKPVGVKLPEPNPRMVGPRVRRPKLVVPKETKP